MPNAKQGEPDIGLDFLDMKLNNPFILASGILGETADLLLSAFKAGAGAVVTKSIGLEPRDGHRNPTIYSTPDGMMNAMGLPNPGIEDFKREMDVLRKTDAVVIGSVFASKPNGFSILAKKMQDYGAAAVELNLSCPHARGYGTEIGSTPASVRRIVKSVAGSVSIPVLAKLTPNTSDICSLGLAAQEAGAKAVVAINTVKAMRIDPLIKRPVLANRYGGLSGSAVKPIGIRCVYELFEVLTIPIIGVGGIATGLDAVEYIMAGATALQIGTAVQTRGVKVFSYLQDELKEFMRKENYGHLSEMRGIVHEP
ncbi:MAG: dihydroorotate dehydrogenase [Thermoplasmata archaeon]|nr:dihydroorotate dehydrogenase [Thermoplasmata archaeon]